MNWLDLSRWNSPFQRLDLAPFKSLELPSEDWILGSQEWILGCQGLELLTLVGLWVARIGSWAPRCRTRKICRTCRPCNIPRPLGLAGLAGLVVFTALAGLAGLAGLIGLAGLAALRRGCDRWTARLWLVDSHAVPRFTGFAELSGLAALPGLAGLAGLAALPVLHESFSTDSHAQDRKENLLNIPC